ncbi:hypothetical protein [Catalinimonas niigatensis]|uniref:hypothetical protein n=1 Tax=Catalinimonas niigatensis TaxID=1397264 RepID=UPI0026658E38|nr:hypothetical protein [Catalinimonas niigatensis]WPP49062.1 hypothetical protein PZB72_20555 [Catalinimonas niigatensis]
MNIDYYKIAEDLRSYHSLEAREEVLEELYHNAIRTLKSVYLFKNFDEYEVQLRASKNESKMEVYWNALYYEKLIDYIKISIAFETYNKAILIENGVLVHLIKKSKKTNELYKIQNKGLPVKIEEFKRACAFKRDSFFENYYLEGLRLGYPTISYSTTLNENYQNIINLNQDLLLRLKEINEKRNRLHFFTEFSGAFEVEFHLKKWRQIMESANETITMKLKERLDRK